LLGRTFSRRGTFSRSPRHGSLDSSLQRLDLFESREIKGQIGATQGRPDWNI